MSSSDTLSPPAKRGRPKSRPEVERRTQAARSEDMQRRILDAAAKVMSSHGYAGFRTAEVSRVAGISRGAQLHHFPTKEQLIVATLAHVYDQALAVSRRRAAAVDPARDILDLLIEDAREFFFSRHFLVAVDIVLSTATEPSVREQVLDIARGARLPVEQAWGQALAAAGIPAELAPGLLSIMLGVVRGLALRKLWDNDPKRDDQQFAMLRDMARAYIVAQGKPRGAKRG